MLNSRSPRVSHFFASSVVPHSPKYTLFAPNTDFAKALSLVSLGSRRNGKQRLCRVLEGKKGVF